MLIRKATYDNAAEIANVHINSWREAYQGILPQDFLDDRPLDFKNRYELWKKVTENSQMTFVAEEADSGVVGCINGGNARDEKFRGQIEIYCIYLLKKFHGRGIGYSLLNKFFETSKEKGFEKSYLWVIKNNPTINFYERAGAEFTGDIIKDKIGGIEVEELCYHWSDIGLVLK